MYKGNVLLTVICIILLTSVGLTSDTIMDMIKSTAMFYCFPIFLKMYVPYFAAYNMLRHITRTLNFKTTISEKKYSVVEMLRNMFS